MYIYLAIKIAYMLRYELSHFVPLLYNLNIYFTMPKNIAISSSQCLGSLTLSQAKQWIWLDINTHFLTKEQE